MRRVWGGRGGEWRGRGGGVSWGPNTMFCVLSGRETLLLSTSAHRTLLEIRAILLSRPSATLSSLFLLYLTQLLLFSKACVRPHTSPVATIFLPAPSISSLTIIAFPTRSALLQLTCSLSSTSIRLSHGHNSTTAKADQEGLSR
jgi:hypothetical protein